MRRELGTDLGQLLAARLVLSAVARLGPQFVPVEGGAARPADECYYIDSRYIGR